VKIVAQVKGRGGSEEREGEDKPRLVMRIRTILVAVLISPYFYQKVDGSGTRVLAHFNLIKARDRESESECGLTGPWFYLINVKQFKLQAA